ncbi:MULTISPECIES: LPS O-antigen chain length determinant protein WzzB [Cedecea]|jgi:chain length determinant protein (polysaccharide antigen chain regulator)|uniref:LPS O-antigen chain length determinant protein WzzB n=1 Tax=Cedecea TaxID=158483 RepID=UPI00068DF4AF|nr:MULTISPECIES: LPS O-antigen chain length determinant protein WzzB [Cedecea]NWC64249.1 LPS O-antigen chain length determinant protein WzzB [Cedecea sp. P7760]
MNTNNSNVTKVNTESHNEESIDLIDLLIQLWRGKKIISIFVIAFILCAVAYLFVAKEKWTSSAIVTLPDAGQLSNYSNAMNVLSIQHPDSAPTLIDVQQRFFGRFNAAISALSEQLDNQQKREQLTIAPAAKDQPLPLKISYVANSAQQAQKTLNVYLQQINKRTVSELDDDLKTSIDAKISDIKEQLSAKEKVAKEKQQKRLDELNQALIVAQQSNITKPVVSQAETLSQDTLFVLGSEALSSMIKNEASRPLPLDNSYFNARQALLAVSELKSTPETTYAFRYIMKPTLPVRKDGPKKGLTLVLAALLGIIVGSGYVLGRNALRNYKPAA